MIPTKKSKSQDLRIGLFKLRGKWIIVFIALIAVLPVIFAILTPRKTYRLLNINFWGFVYVNYQEGESKADPIE